MIAEKLLVGGVSTILKKIAPNITEPVTISKSAEIHLKNMFSNLITNNIRYSLIVTI